MQMALKVERCKENDQCIGKEDGNIILHTVLCATQDIFLCWLLFLFSDYSEFMILRWRIMGIISSDNNITILEIRLVKLSVATDTSGLTVLMLPVWRSD